MLLVEGLLLLVASLLLLVAGSLLLVAGLLLLVAGLLLLLAARFLFYWVPAALHCIVVRPWLLRVVVVVLAFDVARLLLWPDSFGALPLQQLLLYPSHVTAEAVSELLRAVPLRLSLIHI